MYLYFNEAGALKEIINDVPLRQGSSKWNTIYVYWAGEKDNQSRLNLFSQFVLPDNTLTPESSSLEYAIVNVEIPYDKSRDLKFFEYFKDYRMFKVTVPDLALSIKGSVLVSFRLFEDEVKILSLESVPFYVAETSIGSIAPNEYLNIAQYNELLKMLSNLETGGVFVRAVNNPSIIYGTDNTGAQTLLYPAIGNSANAIAKRDANGNTGVGLEPTQPYHATSKQYVDNRTADMVVKEEDFPPEEGLLILSAGNQSTVKASVYNINDIVTYDAFNDLAQDIYEKFEGKKNTYILDTSVTISTIKDEIRGGRTIIDSTGKDISQDIMNGDYDNIWLSNSMFNSNNVRVLQYPDTTQYLFVRKTQETQQSYLGGQFILYKANDTLMEVGDTILVVQTDAPDRWFAGTAYGFYALESRKIDTSASAISFDNSNIVKNYTFEWNGGVYVFVDDEYRPGYAHFNSGDSFIINPSYQDIYLGISREELLSHNSDFTYSGIVYYIPANQLEAITGTTILVKRPRWGNNVQTIVEQLAQEHTEFEQLGEMVKQNMIVLKDTENYEFSPNDKTQHSYLISCVSGWQNLVGIAHIVKQNVYSDKYLLDINFFGINVHNGDTKSPLYNIKTTANAGGPSSNPEYFTLTGLVSGNVVISAILSDCTPENIVGANLNLEDGTGTNAIQMKQDGDSGVFDFTDKNPRATQIDNTLTGDIPYGATGNFATVVGGKAAAQGKRSMAQGTTTIAKGNYSHAEGDNTVALGNESHAEGYQTTASGQMSHAEGELTLASGKASHAEGHYTTAEGEFSYANGYYTYANQPYQFVIGRYNDLETGSQALFVVGNGLEDYRRVNAFMVFKDGHAEVQAMGNTDNSVVTRQYVDNYGTNNLNLIIVRNADWNNDDQVSDIYLDTRNKFPNQTMCYFKFSSDSIHTDSEVKLIFDKHSFLTDVPSELITNNVVSSFEFDPTDPTDAYNYIWINPNNIEEIVVYRNGGMISIGYLKNEL